MTNLGNELRFQWCPLTWWALLYLGSIAVLECLLRYAAAWWGQSWVGYPVVAVGIALLLSVGFLEPRARHSDVCSWVPKAIGHRIIFYLAGLVVGIFFFSGVSPAFDATWGYRTAVILVIVIPMLSLLLAHSAMDHSNRVDRPSLVALRVLGRIPLIIGVAVILLVIALSITDRLMR